MTGTAKPNVGGLHVRSSAPLWIVAATVSLAIHVAVLNVADRSPIRSGGSPSAITMEFSLVDLSDATPQENSEISRASQAQDETSPDNQSDSANKTPDSPERDNRETDVQASSDPVDHRDEVEQAPTETPLPARAKPKESAPRAAADRKAKPDPRKRTAQNQSSARPAQDGARKASQQAMAAITPGVPTASWQSAVKAHIQRHVRGMGNIRGTANVRIAISRSGNVLSASLSRSSGNPALDSEAVALVRRASPVPAPPTGLGGATVTFVSPIIFH